MAENGNNPLGAYSFGAEIDKIQINHITEVSGLKMEQDIIEYKQNTANDGKYQIMKIPGRYKAGECTLTRPLTDDHGFDKWVKDSQQGKMQDAKLTASIMMFDYEGNEVKRYNLEGVLPKSLEIGSMKAGDTNVITEKLVLTYEKCGPA